MVLSARNKIAGATVAILAWSASMARAAESFTVMNSDCAMKVRKLNTQNWVPYVTPIPVGTVVSGTRLQKKPGIVVFRLPTSPDFIASSWSCMFEARPPDELTSSFRASEKVNFSGWNLSFGGISWQETLKLRKLSSSETWALRASTIGICPGDGYQFRTGHYDIGFEGCLSYAKAQLGMAKQDDAAPKYIARNVNVLGLVVGPTALWRPSAGNVAFGVQVPFLLRFALFPEPDGYAVDKRLDWKTGLLLEARLERGTFSLVQKIGVVGGFKQTLWLFSLNHDFR